jgi:hypothetical protein
VFRYTPSGTNLTNLTNLTKRGEVAGQEFVRGFLQHVLPPHFHRIRYYGSLHSLSSLTMDRVRMLVWFYLGWCYILAKRAVAEVPPNCPMRCTKCGRELHLAMMTDHISRILYEHPLPYLDSG